MQKILVLQFACTHSGDEAEAKLARQLPRSIGKKIQAAEVAEVDFLSLRDTVDGAVYFVNSTEVPDRTALQEMAANQGVRFILFGKAGAGERITIDAQVYDAESNDIVFRKFFETYAGYTIDALDEIAYRTVQLLAIGTLAEEQRVAMFRRETASWEAFLYYLMAEDDRYGLEHEIIPHEVELPVSAYLEALRIDPTMEEAERGLVRLLVELAERNLVAHERVLETLSTVVDEFSGMETAAQAFVYFLLALGRVMEAEEEARRSVEAMPESAALHRALADVLLELGRTDEAVDAIADWTDAHPSSENYELLAEFFRMCAEVESVPDADAREKAAMARAEECRKHEELQALPVVSDANCHLN